MKELPVRKNTRLQDHDYSKRGAYFITICVKDRHELLGKIVVGSDDLGAPFDDLGAPFVELSEYGNVIKKYIDNIENHYDVSVNKYIVMPNHIHLLILIKDGVPGSSRPTMLIPNIIAALKKMVNKKIGFDIWQTSYHDHIIRDEKDYRDHWHYIDENPSKWAEDEYYEK